MNITLGDSGFKGEAPAVTARLLAPGFGQVARMARLVNGDLEAWNDLAVVTPLAAAANTIYAMDIGSGVPKWLYWTDDQLGAGAVEVDVARGPVPGDTTERTYLTGLDVPRVTTLALATTPMLPATHAPYVTRPLGVPAPGEAPIIAVTTLEVSDDELTIANPGAEEEGNGWNVSVGDLDWHDTGEVAGLDPHSGNRFFFGGAAASESLAYQGFTLEALAIEPGNVLTLRSWHASGANGSTGSVRIEFYDATSAHIVGEDIGLPDAAVAPALTWEAREATGAVPSDAVTMRLFMHFVRVGAGENDHYIDDISVATNRSNRTLYDGSTALDGWTFTPSGSASITQPLAGYGNPAPAYGLNCNNGSGGTLQKDYKVSKAAKTVISFDAHIDLGGGGAPISVGCDGFWVVFSSGIKVGTDPNWWGGSAAIAGGNYGSGATYHAEITLTKTSADTGDVAVKTTDLAGNLIAEGTAHVSVTGDNVYIRFWEQGNDNSSAWIDNISVEVTTPSPSNQDALESLTNYLYTYVNDLGEESAPSPVSRSVQRSDDVNIEVKTPAVAPNPTPGDWGITKKRIYRAAGTNALYLFVAEIDLADEVYIDSIDDVDLGEALETENYDRPPSDLRGILALPNGVFAGFRRNELCVSVQNRPHAWPVAWRVTTDFPIVAIAAMDTDIIVATQANPYLASCADPSALQMAKLEKPQGCASKRSMVTLDGNGVLYASPDGITVVSRGSIEVISKGLFTREQWQALAPESIRAAVHDGMYWFFYDTGSEQAGYVYDPRSASLVRLDFFAAAAYANPLTDRIYFVIGSNLVEWNAAATKRNYRWRSKLFELPRPTSFEIAAVRTTGTGDLTMRLYADGDATPFFVKTVSGSREFLLPDVVCEDSIEVELEGTRRVCGVGMAESVEELP